MLLFFVIFTFSAFSCTPSLPVLQSFFCIFHSFVKMNSSDNDDDNDNSIFNSICDILLDVENKNLDLEYNLSDVRNELMLLTPVTNHTESIAAAVNIMKKSHRKKAIQRWKAKQQQKKSFSVASTRKHLMFIQQQHESKEKQHLKLKLKRDENGKFAPYFISITKLYEEYNYDNLIE